MKKNSEINEKLRRAYKNVTPDIRSAVLSDCKKQKGQIIEMKPTVKRKQNYLRLAAIAACLCLCITAGALFGIGTYRTENTVDSTVSLDVNPSIELQINKKERVLDVVALNNDGKTIIGDMELVGCKLDVAVSALIGSMLKNGYLSELANSILVSVDNKNEQRGAALREKLTAEIDKLLKTDSFSGAVLSQMVTKSEELKTIADKYGISVGKAQLINEIISKNPTYTFEELSSLSINELNLIMRKLYGAIGEEGSKKLNIVGEASDKAYIGSEQAKKIALDAAGVSYDEVTLFEIEFDVDDGRIIYEIEFVCGNFEYDYEIDASNGSIIKSEKEAIDSPVVPQPPKAKITADEAKKIALAHAGVLQDDAKRLEIDTDDDDGRIIYEIEFACGNFEYDYEIDASNGNIIKSEKEIIN